MASVLPPPPAHSAGGWSTSQPLSVAEQGDVLDPSVFQHPCFQGQASAAVVYNADGAACGLLLQVGWLPGASVVICGAVLYRKPEGDGWLCYLVPVSCMRGMGLELFVRPVYGQSMSLAAYLGTMDPEAGTAPVPLTQMPALAAACALTVHKVIQMLVTTTSRMGICSGTTQCIVPERHGQALDRECADAFRTGAWHQPTPVPMSISDTIDFACLDGTDSLPELSLPEWCSGPAGVVALPAQWESKPAAGHPRSPVALLPAWPSPPSHSLAGLGAAAVDDAQWHLELAELTKALRFQGSPLTYESSCTHQVHTAARLWNNYLLSSDRPRCDALHQQSALACCRDAPIALKLFCANEHPTCSRCLASVIGAVTAAMQEAVASNPTCLRQDSHGFPISHALAPFIPCGRAGCGQLHCENTILGLTEDSALVPLLESYIAACARFIDVFGDPCLN